MEHSQGAGTHRGVEAAERAAEKAGGLLAQPDRDRGAAGAGRNRMRCHGGNERLCHGTDRAPVPDWLINMMKVSLAASNKWGAVQIGKAPLVALQDVTFSITLFIALSFPKQVKKAGEKREKTMNRGKLKIP